MKSELLKVSVERTVAADDGLHISYTLESKHSGPLHLVQHARFPIVRFSPDQSQIEAWMGVPPQSELERTRFINLLQLPATMTLQPKAILKRTIIIPIPIMQGGFWTEDSEYTAVPIEKDSDYKLVVIQGYGLNELNHRNVRNIKQLFEWQLTSESRAIIVIMPQK